VLRGKILSHVVLLQRTQNHDKLEDKRSLYRQGITMSQEPPQPQEPQPPQRPEQPAKSSGTSQKLAQVWQTAQPVLVQQSINLLRSMIQALQVAQTKLEVVATELPAPDARVENTLTRLRSLLERLWIFWKGLLQRVRSRLPQTWQQKLQPWSEPALTWAIAGILFLVLWTTSALTPESAPPPKLATRPTAPVKAPIKTVPVQPAFKSTPSPTPIQPALKPTPALPTVPKVEQSPAIANKSPVETPVALKSTPATSPTPSPQLKIAPSPKPAVSPPVVKLTPEQALIADVQSQVSGIADRYGKGLSQSVQPNFVGSRLRLRLADDWYDLKPSQQDALAQEVLQRSRALDFSQLEILDQQQHLLARNPVIGDQVIILQRKPL
jgi:hypothetical protein